MIRTVETSPGNFETLDFIPVSDPNRLEFEQDFKYSNPESDNSTADFLYTSKRRQMLAAQIYSRDHSDFIEQTGENPCEKLLRFTRRHGDFAPQMLRAYTNILERKDAVTAMSMVEDAHNRLLDNGIRYTRTDEEIVELAKAKARAFSKQLLIISNIRKRFEKAEQLLDSLGIQFREELVKQKEDSGELEFLINRVMCDKWLRRQLRRQYFARVEAVARDLMLVHKSQDAYCSKHSVGVMRERASDSEQALINTVCYQEDDPQTWFTLQELAAKSTSNPMIRRAEMFVRLKAFDEIAQDNKHKANFYTITAPSRFHVYKGDELNPAWIKAGKPSAMDAHNHLKHVMDNFRKELNKREIKIYGMRIVEPHHDGTPHYHALFFMEKRHEKVVSTLLRKFALADSPNEQGASRHRFKKEAINRKKGSAVGYVAKYLCKNIDGKHISTDKDTGKDSKASADSVVSFNRIQGIRQFQFYGGPSITAWREMRRLREEIKEDDAIVINNQFTKEEHFVLETIRRAADTGDFKAFVMAMGGVFVKRNDQTVKVEYAKKTTAEGLFMQTRYGDEMSAAIRGIQVYGRVIPTRFHDWKFANKKQFVRGIRNMMKGTKQVFDSLEDELEYYAMKQEEFERMQDEIAFLLASPAMDTSMMYGDEIYNLEEVPPPDLWVTGAASDPDGWVALDLCH